MVYGSLGKRVRAQMITVYGRDELNEFTESGKFKGTYRDHLEIRGRWERPSSDDLGEKMEAVEEALRKAMERKTSWLS